MLCGKIIGHDTSGIQQGCELNTPILFHSTFLSTANDMPMTSRLDGPIEAALSSDVATESRDVEL